jgi:hypothetical protein
MLGQGQLAAPFRRAFVASRSTFRAETGFIELTCGTELMIRSKLDCDSNKKSNFN